VIWLKLKVLEFLKKTRVVLQAVEWPSHLTFDPLVQLLLLVRVLDPLFFDKSFPNLKVTLSFVQITQLARVVLILA